MAFLLIVLTLLTQHYLLKERPSIPVTGYQALFFDSAVVTSWPQFWRLLIWLFVPMAIFMALDGYIRSHFALVVSLPLHFAVAILAFGYPEVRQTIRATQQQKKPVKPKCLFLEETGQTLHNDFFLVTITSLRCLFCVLFFSFLFAGYGALLVMLVYAFALRDSASQSLARLVMALEWIPVRLLYFTLALDNNISAIKRVASSFTNAWSAEKLVADLVVQDIFEQNLRRKTIKLGHLWLRQLAIWMAAMAIAYLILMLAS